MHTITTCASLDLGQAPTSTPITAAALRIGGLTRLTTIDYPGELAAVIFCQGCAWRCRYCHNPALLDPDAVTAWSWATILAFLKQRQNLLDAVVFSGGEPTTQHALAAAMTEVRELGFKVGLHTNGAYPDRLRQLLPLLDWVGLDIKALPLDYPAITGVVGSGTPAWDSLALLLEAEIAVEVRTTIMPGWTPAEVAQLAQTLADAGVTHFALQACDTIHALDPHLSTPPALATFTAHLDSGRFTHFTTRGI
ncbi:anaerobic ribonucleoside-triphosphate reductase activating protein [Chromatium okenii]|uniref:anaerobic ribonucleoside-triphosphate reductase activating protein n=1 Tax=Chromatium okenii TaxID=61644 RepID=UPI0019035BFB|nr:anaerobic ribonucleoside-triphosphate reductase activating protein [Chromatium okenii]MBK1642169.1 anaerobic ribonucleoside-triphosphate reductase activating protein [Chromatium okenii]